MTDSLDLDFASAPTLPPAGRRTRFGARWRLVGAGLSNVWRYGDLDLAAPSGRLLLRGPNGTGKTTALEALWPYLLDLNPLKLPAGKARPTTLKLLMSEGAAPKGRRYGYAWLTFASPAVGSAPRGAEELVSFGVRLQYSPSSTPAVKVVPFCAPGRPLLDLALRGPGGRALEHEEFTNQVRAAGGQVFDSPEDYVEHLAARIWAASATELLDLAARLRAVRNPSLLGGLSPNDAAEALRQSLPGVAVEVIGATAEALAESDTTRDAFERDEHAAKVLAEFATVWTGHVVDVARSAHTEALDAATELGARRTKVRQCETAVAKARSRAESAAAEVRELDVKQKEAVARARAIELSEAYRAHNRVTDLRRQLEAERETAQARLDYFVDLAERARSQTRAGQAALDQAVTELAELADEASTVGGGSPVPVDALLGRRRRPRTTRSVAELAVDPGPGIAVTYDEKGLDALASGWARLAEGARAEAGTARLILRDHRPVADTAIAARAADEKAGQAEARHDESRQLADLTAGEAMAVSRDLLAATAAWASLHPELRGLGEDGTETALEEQSWDLEDVEQLTAAEPATVLKQVSAWADQGLRLSESIAAGHAAAAKMHVAEANRLQTEAGGHRDHAQRLRSGVLLSLPRPDWAGPGDDEVALGAALEWHPGLDADDDTRARIELALVRAGVLGARLDVDGAETDVWRVAALGSEVTSNLSAVLDVQLDHPRAGVARAVLSRIGWAATAEAGPEHTLVIGRDGSFGIGPLIARPAQAVAATGEGVPAGGYVGARARLARTRSRADELDALADDLEAEARYRRREAAELHERRDRARRAAASFPQREDLRGAETARAQAAEAERRRRTAAAELRSKADESAAEHARRYAEWVARARGLGMPADPDRLPGLIDSASARADALASCERRMRVRLRPTIARAIAALPDETELAGRLGAAQHHAQTAHDKAFATAALLSEAESVGDVDDAVARFEAAIGEAEELAARLVPSRESATDAARLVSAGESDLANAEARLAESRPWQVATQARLTALLGFGPVAAVLGVDDFLASRDQERFGVGDDLLAAVDDLLAGRRSYARKTVGERYDDVRAELAQTWTIARADPPPGLDGLDMFVLTRAESEFDPHHAAAQAVAVRDRARAALDAAEASALRDFVIGRLPSAIGTAWNALRDWKLAVNAKMRAARASSGVGVQVEIALREDLDPTARTVYELSCTVGDALRTESQRQQVGAALLSLLAATDGSTMTERLSSAIDIRNWVDVHYLVERPEVPTPRRWGSRTGLSGGERRLVVLAPMLAAVAANYDRLGSTGLRLVPLDEVPAEVDERGREGLARFIAELDLDLLCTSYLWDGCPGAWDGIDAADLEAAADGTVVAFPTHVRGPEPLPDDTDEIADVLAGARPPDRA